MPWLGTITVIGLAILAVLTWFFFRTLRKDQIEELLAKKRSSARLATRAEYVQGIERIPVALALTADTLYYQNPDLDASFEMGAIDEVEYDDELATGQNVEAGFRALRLRAHGRAIEFVLVEADAKQWAAVLTPRRTEGVAAHAT